MLTNLFASALQKSQPRRKLTSTTLRFFALFSSPAPKVVLASDDALNAAYRYLKTNQFPVAPRTDETSVREDWGREDT